MAQLHAPRLFIAGEADNVIAHSLVEKNMRACTRADSVNEHKLFEVKDGVGGGGAVLDRQEECWVERVKPTDRASSQR